MADGDLSKVVKNSSQSMHECFFCSISNQDAVQSRQGLQRMIAQVTTTDEPSRLWAMHFDNNRDTLFGCTPVSGAQSMHVQLGASDEKSYITTHTFTPMHRNMQLPNGRAHGDIACPPNILKRTCW